MVYQRENVKNPCFMQIKRHLGALLGYVNISLKYIFNFVAICKSLFWVEKIYFSLLERFWKKDGISSFDAFFTFPVRILKNWIWRFWHRHFTNRYFGFSFQNLHKSLPKWNIIPELGFFAICGVAFLRIPKPKFKLILGYRKTVFFHFYL